MIPLFACRDKSLNERLGNALLAVLDSGHYLMGEPLRNFEQALANYHGMDYAHGVGNGTDALALSMLALGIQPGDTIVTVPNAGGYSSFAANMIGAKSAMVDIDPATMQICPDSLAELLNNMRVLPKAIVVTHLYGLMAPIVEIKVIADRYEIPIIEDVAQAMGACLVDGNKAGTYGKISAFSFYPTKNLGACGDAGAILTNETELSEKIQYLRQYGWTQKYKAEIPYGRNSRMDDMQAAILNIKLPYLEEWNEKRRSIWLRYKDSISGQDMRMIGINNASFSAHLAVVAGRDIDKKREAMNGRGIATAVHYPIHDHEQTALKDVILKPVALPGADSINGRIFTVPCFPDLEEREIAMICDALKDMAS